MKFDTSDRFLRKIWKDDFFCNGHYQLWRSISWSINICKCIKFCYTRTYFCKCTLRKRQMFFSNKSQKRPIIKKVTPKFETFSNLFHEWRCNHSSFLTLNFFASICFDSAWNWEFFILIDKGQNFCYFKLQLLSFTEEETSFFYLLNWKRSLSTFNPPPKYDIPIYNKSNAFNANLRMLFDFQQYH